jgi:Plant PDR ABC transporter associated
VPGSDVTIGDQILIDRGLPTDAFWVPLGIGALVAFSVAFNLLTWAAHAWLPCVRPAGFC